MNKLFIMKFGTLETGTNEFDSILDSGIPEFTFHFLDYLQPPRFKHCLSNINKFQNSIYYIHNSYSTAKESIKNQNITLLKYLLPEQCVPVDYQLQHARLG